MPAKSNPAAGLAEKMVQVLRAQRDLGEDGYPLTLQRLAERADPSAPQDLLGKAVKQKVFTAQAVLAQKKHPDTPVALAEDLGRLADSRLLLEWLLEQNCTPEAPAQPVDRLVKKVETSLRQPLAEAIDRRLRADALPETVGSVAIRKKPHLYLKRMPPPKPPAEVLAEKLVEVLRSLRDRGEPYPVPLEQLLGQAAAGTEPRLIGQALAHDAFRRQVVAGAPKDPAAPVALASDLGRLAGSRALLEYALASACTPKSRTAPVERLREEVAPELGRDFEESVHRQIRDGTLPETVGVLTLDGQTVLYRTALPPEASFVLASRLLHELRSRRERGGDGYPAPLGQLLREIQPGASSTLVHRALADRDFKKQAVLAVANNLEAPLALKGDERLLASSPLLLEFLLAESRTEANQALPVTDLKKRLAKDLRQPFENAARGLVAAHSLPAGVGMLRIKEKEHLFLLRDVSTGSSVPPAENLASAPAAVALPSPPEPLPASFDSDFDETFERLDRQRGGNNFVSLVDLRRELPYDRETFDRELRRLRRAGRYTLSAAEGRHGLRPEEQQAAVHEEGTLLLFVSRRTS